VQRVGPATGPSFTPLSRRILPPIMDLTRTSPHSNVQACLSPIAVTYALRLEGIN
jgi:hypothetical protein